jgi:hypothetical protein
VLLLDLLRQFGDLLLLLLETQLIVVTLDLVYLALYFILCELQLLQLIL